MTDKTFNTKSLPLLKQIDEGLNADNIEWNKNAFETLLTSNLSNKTISYYAIDVGLRRLENSLFETYWDETADALNDLSQYLFNVSFDEYADDYLHEAKCQLLMYSAISIIKMNTIRRRSIHDAKMACAVIFYLLLEQKQSYEIPRNTNEYSACMRSMHCRYLKRIFIMVQWLSTLLKTQQDDIQTNHEKYIGIIVNQLFPSVSLQERINNFIDTHLFGNNDNDVKTSDFVFIRQFPMFSTKLIDKYNDLMIDGLDTILHQFDKNQVRKLTCCIWTLCCMIESNRISLDILSRNVKREHFSSLPVDFERKSVKIESLNEQDVIIFLLLCARQNVHVHTGDSTLHPYLLFSFMYTATKTMVANCYREKRME